MMNYRGHIQGHVDAERITRVIIIRYRNPRRPDEGATRLIPDRSEIEEEKRRLEGLGFVIVDISMPYVTRDQA
jgi:hypothetical protein